MKRQNRKKPRRSKKGCRRKSSQALQQSAAVTVYRAACRLACNGRYDDARQKYHQLKEHRDRLDNPRLSALIENDLAVLDAVEGSEDKARSRLLAAIESDRFKEPATSNLAALTLRDEKDVKKAADQFPQIISRGRIARRRRIAIVSFLFNWPSTGGGNIHTVELAQFLMRAGYEVKHFYADFRPWQIGNVSDPLSFPSEKIEFDESQWAAPNIQKRYREAVDRFRPDRIIITDSWNFKPLLAEALSEYPYILRMQAQECLCPLNNLGLLIDNNHQFSHCENNQLTDPDRCRYCLATRAGQSGFLHQAERALSGVGTEGYYCTLRKSFEQAAAVLILNPSMKSTYEPFCRSVCVVTWGMDPERFPWPWAEEPVELRRPGVSQLIFAGLRNESIKGFHVLLTACEKLWRRRQDFELICTSDPPGQFNPFTRFVGWLPQSELPRYLRAADICIVPTIVPDGLSRTSVEAMAVGRPVIGSRLGGLPYSIEDGVTGLLFQAGDADDLAVKIEALLDDPVLRKQMGISGRKTFEERFCWNEVIERDYRPLLEPPVCENFKKR